jgi:DNA-binding transcriptional ArsR family regulator
MPARYRSLLHFSVTPRFEIFYALRVFEERSSFASRWRSETAQKLPAEFQSAATRVAPRPMMWALLADSLRDSKPAPTFPEIIQTIASLDEETFQRAVLNGVFRKESVVTDLITGRQLLGDVVATESEKSRPLIGMLGLHPFKRSGAVASAFTRIISEPTEFRSDLSKALEMFWSSAFSDDWSRLEPKMRRRVDAMEDARTTTPLHVFATSANLPVVFDDWKRTVSNARGAVLFRYRDLREIHVIPSAFNDSRLWGAYTDSSGALRLYFPVFDGGLLKTAAGDHAPRSLERNVARTPDPAQLFRALGDTTRYAMARVLARSPRTSVELAKEFSVSKATISHHVQVLRQAGLLRERATEKGVALAIDRDALEELAREAGPAIFAPDKPVVIQRSRHEGGRRK